MTFRRTGSGLSNMHLFLGVDAVVYLEGGESLTREEVNRGSFSDVTFDIIFWRGLFSKYLPEKKFQFRSVGAKVVVSSIAEDISQGKVENVIAVMDRDFDNHKEKIISDANVIYTMGYAWENDCWQVEVVAEALVYLSGLCPERYTEIKEVVAEEVETFQKFFRQPVKADLLAAQYGQSYFDRKKPARYISLASDKRPVVNSSELYKEFSRLKNKLPRPVVRRAPLILDTLMDCFGHLLEEYMYRVLCFYLGVFGVGYKLAKQFAATVILDKFSCCLREGGLSYIDEYYQMEFGKIKI